MTKQSAKVAVKSKELIEVHMQGYEGSGKLDEFSLSTTLEAKDDFKKRELKITFKTIIAPPMNKELSIKYLISYTADCKLSLDNVKGFLNVILNDFNFLCMALTQQVSGNYVLPVPNPEYLVIVMNDTN